MKTENRNEIPSLCVSNSQSYTEEPQQINTRLSRRLLVGLIRFAALLYQTLVLLGLHHFYLRHFSSAPENISSDDKITELPSLIAPIPDFEALGWERKYAILLRSAHRKYTPVVANSYALYHVLTSVTSSNTAQEPITSTIRIIAVIICANAIILSTYFLHYAPAFNIIYLGSFRDESINCDVDNTIIDRCTQAAMLMSVPSASTFWALTSVVIYHCSTFAISKVVITVIPSSPIPTSMPWWFTALISTALVLCLIHFFGIVLWLGHLEGSSEDYGSTHLPLPCTFAGRRASRSFSSLPTQKRAPSVIGTMRKSHSIETSDSKTTLVDIPRIHSHSDQCQSEDDTRSSRKAARSPSPYQRTPAASPRPTKKQKGKKNSKSSSHDSQENVIEAPQVVKCSSSSSSTPPFPCSFRR